MVLCHCICIVSSCVVVFAVSGSYAFVSAALVAWGWWAWVAWGLPPLARRTSPALFVCLLVVILLRWGEERQLYVMATMLVS